MALLDELKADQRAARELNDHLKADLLTLLIGEATQMTIEEFERGVTEATDEKVVATISKVLKSMKRTLDDLTAEHARLFEAGRDASKVAEWARAAEIELAILASYGPQQMTQADLREAIKDFKATNPDANVGTIMAHLKASFGGQYDGKTASALAKA